MEIDICCIKVKKFACAMNRHLSLTQEAATFLLEEVMAFKFQQGEVSYLQDKKKGVEMISGDMTDKDLGERHGRNYVELEAVDFCSGRRTQPGSPHNA